MMNLFRKLLLILVILGIIDVGRYFVYPDINAIKEIPPVPTAFMQYREEQWAQQNRDMHITHTWVSMRNISPNIIKAVLIGEDDGFYHHDGFDAPARRTPAAKASSTRRASKAKWLAACEEVKL